MKNWKYIDGAKVGNAVTDKEFKSEADLRRWCMEHNYTYTPVGGGYYRLEDDKPGSRRADIEAHVTGNKNVGNFKDDKKAQQLWDEMQHAKKLAEDWAREIHRTGKEEYKGSQKDAEEAYRKAKREYEKYAMNAKTGNANYRYKGYLITKSDEDGEIIVYKPNGRDVAFRGTKSESIAKDWVDHHEVGNEKTGAEGFFKQLSDDVKDREKKDDADIEKVGNYKTGTSKLKAGDKVTSYGAKGVVKSVSGENTDNIYGEPIIEVEFESGVVKKIPEHYLVKVGNSVVKTIKDFEIDIEKRPGENYWRWYVDHKNGDNLDSGFENSKEEAIRAAEQKINSGSFRSPIRNKKTLNSAFTSSDKKRLDELAKKKPTQLTPQEWKEFQDLNKREEEASREMLKKSGNSASDDKFAYVMREFDEGKLKTPDGKVVTDPAQAKAIAYSESKKTENGLARARNAIKKS